MEVALSSAFVEFPEHGYGTRSSTVLVASRPPDPIASQSLRINMTEQTHLHFSRHQIPAISSVCFHIE
jgi:hypothetical protein